MPTYYVRKSGNDGDTGLAPGNAWLTVTQAANTMVAGDTVYIGAGVYRETVPISTSGAVGSLIYYVGDFMGNMTGDPGHVVITGIDSEEHWAWQSVRREALTLGQYEFLDFQNIIFICGQPEVGYSYAVYGAGVGHVAFEQVSFRRCVFITPTQSDAVFLQVNDGDTPATTGATFSRCVFRQSCRIEGNNNVTAHTNLKMLFENCEFQGSAFNTQGGVYVVRNTSANAFSFGGITIRSCTAHNHTYGLMYDPFTPKNTTDPCYIENGLSINGGGFGVDGAAAIGAWVVRGLRYNSPLLGNASRVTMANCRRTNIYPGLLWVQPWNYHYGFYPYRLYEPINQYKSLDPTAVNQADPTYLPAYDAAYTDWAHSLPAVPYYTFFDASDAAVTDPGGVWLNDANICAFDYDATLMAQTATQGSSVANYLMAEGVAVEGQTAPITQVKARILAYASAGGESVDAEIYTNGMAETLVAISEGLSVGAGYEDAEWSAWNVLAAPALGWDWATLAALEFRLWKTNASANTIYVLMIQLEVICGNNGSMGAVQGWAQDYTDGVVTYGGNPTTARVGAGWRDFFFPVTAALTTISCYMRYSAGYSGASLPQLIVSDIPGVVDQTDTMTVGAATWEQLSCNFTPTSAGVVRVRVLSRDAGLVGQTNWTTISRT